MSTQVNTYVMFGCLLDYDELKTKNGGSIWDKIEPYTDNAFKPEFNPQAGITVLYDGANGKYVAIGHVVAKTENWQGFQKPIELPSSRPPPSETAAIFELMKELKVAHRYEPSWFVISHYR